MKDKVAGVVVLYNPDVDVIDNIERYVHDLGRLYVVDNSERTLSATLEDYLAITPNVEHIRFGENHGIATALNTGARRAVEEGFEWLLTMDQDSRTPPGMVSSLYDLSQEEVIPNVGIVAAQYSGYPHNIKFDNLPRWSIPVKLITSGNLVRLKAWAQLGGWDDRLFIDRVDYDFNYRMQLSGWEIVQMNQIVLDQMFGETKTVRIMGRTLFWTSNYNYLRWYYFARNRRYIRAKYGKTFPKYLKEDRREEFRDVIKVILAESDKIRKLQSIIRGRRDFRKGVWGKYRW